MIFNRDLSVMWMFPLVEDLNYTAKNSENILKKSVLFFKIGNFFLKMSKKSSANYSPIWEKKKFILRKRVPNFGELFADLRKKCSFWEKGSLILEKRTDFFSAFSPVYTHLVCIVNAAEMCCSPVLTFPYKPIGILKKWWSWCLYFSQCFVWDPSLADFRQFPSFDSFFRPFCGQNLGKNG